MSLRGVLYAEGELYSRIGGVSRTGRTAAEATTSRTCGTDPTGLCRRPAGSTTGSSSSRRTVGNRSSEGRRGREGARGYCSEGQEERAMLDIKSAATHILNLAFYDIFRLLHGASLQDRRLSTQLD